MAQFIFGLILTAFGLGLAFHERTAARTGGVLLAVAGALFVFGSPADSTMTLILLALVGGFALFLFARPKPPVEDADEPGDNEFEEAVEDESCAG